MGYLMKLAFRNVGRNRRRSVLAAVSVGLAVMFIVFMQGMTGGFLDSIVRNYTKNETGHIRIAAPAFEERARFYPVTETIANPGEIMNKLKGKPEIARHIASITSRIQFGVLLSNDGKNKSAAAIAGDPENEKDLLMLHKSIQEGGRYLQNEREMILGKKCAEALGYGVGDTVKVVTQGSDYALHMRKFTLVGIFETGLNALDDQVFQIGLSDARRLLRMGNAVQQIVIMLHDYKKAEDVASLVKESVNDAGVAVTPWTAIGDYGKMVAVAGKVYNLAYYAVALLGAFIITNILLMVVLERRKEIGIMKSMGFRRIEILGLFLAEGAILGGIGSIAGASLGLLLVTYFHFRGIDFTAMTGSFTIPMDSIIYFTIKPLNAIWVILMGTAISALVSINPSRKAARMNAVDAMKSV